MVFWGPIEIVAILVQTILAIVFGTVKYAAVSGVAFITYVIVNIAFYAFFTALIAHKDESFKYWREANYKTYKCIGAFSLIFSFKVSRLYYSFFFGHDRFKAIFAKPGSFQRTMIFFTCANAIFTSVLILAVDAFGLYAL